MKYTPGVTAATPAPASPPPRIDFEAFDRELRALRREILEALGPEDLDHLKKIERLGRACTALGLATAWIVPNPLSAAALAAGRGTRWGLMHHIAHRGYDRVPGVPERYKSTVFARGWRRFLDWPEWMTPEGWTYEHNVLHHAHTGAEEDPDLVERNVAWVRDLPRPVRWALLGFFSATWRPVYYAPTTLQEYLGRHGDTPSFRAMLPKLLRRSYLPYAAYAFLLVPLAFAPLGPWAVFSVGVNSLFAEVLTNVHTFVVIVPNHAGDDVYRFDDACPTRVERYFRQVVGSVNYRVGAEKVGAPAWQRDLLDWAHLWLNYQIEHHVFPDLPMLKYQQYQPRVRAICERHGVPYVQGSVFERFRKMARNFVGDADMLRYPATA